jgi:hypothetical protein
MLEVAEKLDEGPGGGNPVFLCPECGEEDVLYIRSPVRCYSCGHFSLFDLNWLLDDQEERVYYHIHGYTSNCDTGVD